MATLATEPTTYTAYGDGCQIWGWVNGSVPAPAECLYEGQAGGGKTRLMCEVVRSICSMYPESKGLILRKTRVSLNDSVLPIWEDEVLGPLHPAVLGRMRETREFYRHPSLGGEVRLGGMDNPTKLFSTQYNWIWVNEANELSLEDWESLHRALRRKGTPFRILIGDCNPDAEGHWLNKRFNRGDPSQMVRVVGKIYDNPVFFNHELYAECLEAGMSTSDASEASWTKDGREYTKRLATSLTGHRLQRLYHGKWVSAEGQVWPNFDRSVHCIAPPEITDEERENGITVSNKLGISWHFASVDWGYRNAGAMQVWGVDYQRRMYRLAEIYKSARGIDWWSDRLQELHDEYRLRAVLCDPSRPDDIRYFNEHVGAGHSEDADMPGFARGADNRKDASKDTSGLDVVRHGFDRDDDGKPRLFFVQGALRTGIDEVLDAKLRPVCTEDEIGSYVWEKTAEGNIDREHPSKDCQDHGCDATRYACMYAWKRDLVHQEPSHKYKAGTWGRVLDFDSLLQEAAETPRWP